MALVALRLLDPEAAIARSTSLLGLSRRSSKLSLAIPALPQPESWLSLLVLLLLLLLVLLLLLLLLSGLGISFDGVVLDLGLLPPLTSRTLFLL